MGITYQELRDAVVGDGVGVRSRTVLEPLGGAGDKIFPPTYGVENNAETKYATEKRRVGGADVDSVLLDSVASQANRFELALLEAVRNKELALPLVSVDFRDRDKVRDLDLLSSLEAPHRIYDAILRDSLLGDRAFRLSEPGLAITAATVRNAAALFHYNPGTLLFGGWDSTGPKGGRGSKFERAITSEVVAIGISRGVKTGSRIDPLAIELKAATVFEAPDDLRWTLDPDQAVRDEKDKPKPVKGGGEGQAGRPSQINHGNVTPSIDARAGGITADEIVATTVLSFVALRRLRFPVDHKGDAIDPARRHEAEGAARTALAALGLAATVLAFESGFDLRSRCVLAPVATQGFELLRRSGGEPTAFTLEHDEALALVAEASAASTESGLPWMTEELLLQPADRLVDLIERSRRLTETSAVDDPGDES
jgi:CRISPR-associated protein Csb1